MATTAFKKLEVYRLSEELADAIWRMVSKWDWFAKASIGKQMVRAVDSIGANIAEGVGRGTCQDNRRFVRIARGSLNETMHWLRRGYARNLVTREEVSKLRPLIREPAPRLNAYLKSIGPAPKCRNIQLTTDNHQLTTDN